MVPRQLDLDTFDGWCWIGVVPFRMTDVRPRCLPMPLAFPELNVRTYVKTPGRNGVWFFSLDAASWIVVRAARAWYGLPYFDARMSVQIEGDALRYQSARNAKRAAPAEFSASYRPIAPAYHAAPGTLDHWLTERYCLYAAGKRDRIFYSDIHHGAWPLQPVEVELRVNTMTRQIGINLAGIKPVSRFARYQGVVAWPLAAIEGK